MTSLDDPKDGLEIEKEWERNPMLYTALTVLVILVIVILAISLV